MLMSINWIEILVCFVAYFIGGYLLYASILAIGSAVDNETDTQQFMLPITIPILFAMYAAIYSAQNPDGPFGVLVFDDPVYFAHCDSKVAVRCAVVGKLFLW